MTALDLLSQLGWHYSVVVPLLPILLGLLAVDAGYRTWRHK